MPSKSPEETRELMAKIRQLKETQETSAKMDWQAVRRQLDDGKQDETLDQATIQQAWARRAAQVAISLDEHESGEMMEVAVIRLGAELYGLDVSHVFDIRVLDHITRVPRVPDWVAGVVNLRGRIISALDVRRFLGLPADANAEETANRHLVVVEAAEMELALLADEVLAIESIPISRIQEASGAVRGIRAEYVRGVVVQTENSREDEAGLLILLDLPVLLADKRLLVHDEV
jgi:purine-binding chemotaxis protein CheW